MKAHIEWFVGLIRVGEKLKKYGDPYEFVVTVVRDENTAKLVGAAGKFNKEAHKAICQALKKEGIKDVVWVRANNKKRNKKRNLG